MRENEAEGVDGDWSMGDGDGDGDGVTMNDRERVRKMQLSIAASTSVFPGFRFSPTDDELISYYLKKKLQGCDDCVDIIPEVDFCRHEPWDLPALSIIRSDNEWFFFSSRGKKYPNGSQSKRATQSGYWKATGKERNVKSGSVTIGTKRTLVFHTGRAPKGERTEWIMHEYCMTDTTPESLVVCRLRRNSDFRLTDHRNLDNGNSATNEYADANAQFEWFDEAANTVKSYCSKESTSSYWPLSVEQNQSGSESPDGFSSKIKKLREDEDEDDCFADIINDDIVKLDEESASTSNSLTFHGTRPLVQQEAIMSSHDLSRQGTTFRRIKMRLQKPSSASDTVGRKDEKKSSGCIIDLLTSAATHLPRFISKRMILVIFLFSLMVFLGWQGKQYLQVEASRRQLRYWLRKAADHL